MKTSIATAMFGLAIAFNADYFVPQEQQIKLPHPDELIKDFQLSEILAGIAYGFVDAEGCTEIDACVAAGTANFIGSYIALRDLWIGEEAQGWAEVVEVAKGWPNLIYTCIHVQDDIGKLEAIAANVLAQPDIPAYFKANIASN